MVLVFITKSVGESASLLRSLWNSHEPGKHERTDDLLERNLSFFPFFSRKDTFSDDFGLILNNFFITSLQLGEGRSQISEEYYNE